MNKNNLIVDFTECLTEQGFYKKYWEFEIYQQCLVSHSPEATRWLDKSDTETRKKYVEMIETFNNLLLQLYSGEDVK